MPKSESLTKLLKAKNVSLSAVKVNKILLKMGLLVEKERVSTKDASKIKKYKVLTEEALKFGENRENINNPDETAPYYYAETFDELLKAVQDNQ